MIAVAVALVSVFCSFERLEVPKFYLSPNNGLFLLTIFSKVTTYFPLWLNAVGVVNDDFD